MEEQQQEENSPVLFKQALMASCYPMCSIDDDEMVCGEVPAYKERVDSLAARPGYGSAGKKLSIFTNYFGVSVNCPAIYQYKVSIHPEPKLGVTKKAVLSEIVKLHGERVFRNKIPVFDARKSLYTAHALPIESETFVIKLDDDEDKTRIDLQDLQSYHTRRNASQGAIQAIDAVVRALLSSCLSAPGTIFSTKFGPIIDTQEGLEFWRGCYKGVRLSQIGPGLNIDIPAAPFYKPLPVVEFVAELLNRTDVNQLFSTEEYYKVEKALQGVFVETTHRTDKTIRYKIKGLSVVPLEDLMFAEGAKENFTTTVVDYFQKCYKYKLKYIYWPCLQCGSSRDIFLPMEVCKILPGQRYCRKLTTRQAAKLLKATCERPHIRKIAIMKVRNNCNVERCVEEFGIKVNGLPAIVRGRILPTPELKYHVSGNERTCVPTGGRWNMINKIFCSKMIKTCNFLGMRVCETKLGLVSQCCLPKNVKTYTNIKYLENIALKINVKVGGRNTVLQQAFVHNGIPFVSDIPTIIFGADVSHPPPGMYSSSIAGVVGSIDWPEVTTYRAVISAQLERQEIIGLFHSTQDPKGCLKPDGMIRELMMNFYQRNRRKPERIIFYRDGISESQFSQVIIHEVDAIRKACLSLQEDYLPPITLVIVQKRHHTRIFPHTLCSNYTEQVAQIPSGTVIDQDICHPSGFDFYLCSHTSQGNSRPTHYTVIFDENHFTADGLQLLTHNLCYMYARCTRAVSIVPPVYYAHLAAARGRSYLGKFGDGSSIRNEVSSELPEFLKVPKIADRVLGVMAKAEPLASISQRREQSVTIMVTFAALHLCSCSRT
uniref:Piwi domain-containing protein n=1 Tax=Oryza glumipatula TaxID=40148 RepID=A0A0D9YUZ2_9ORYZ